MRGNKRADGAVRTIRMSPVKRIACVRAAAWIAIVGAAAAMMLPLSARQAPPACRIAGTVGSGGIALPGVSIVAFTNEAVKAATSSDTDGTYRLIVPHGTYRLTAELTGFDPVHRELAVRADLCEQAIDLQLSLTRPVARPAMPAVRSDTQRPDAPRFETLAVQAQAAASSSDAGAERDVVDAATRLLLPPGFSTDAPTEAVAITGSMASIDRGMLGQRFDAIGRGEFDPITGEVAEGLGPGGRGGPGAFGGPGGRGGPGQGPGGRGGRGGPGAEGFVIGGRGGRQNLYAGNATYTFGGSALDSSPYQLRPDSPIDERPYTRQNVTVAFGGPVRIPGVYNGTRRTNFNVTYAGNRGSSLFDQYATVPSVDMRSGDFSFSSLPVLDPVTGLPFMGNRIPRDRIDPSASVLLEYIPLPNVPGATPNFHHLTTTASSADNVNVRVMHNFTPGVAGRGGRGGGGRIGGPGGRGGRAMQGTSVVLNAQLQYRSNDSDQMNVLPTLGGTNRGTTLSVPIGLNVMRRGVMHNVNVNVTRTRSTATNRYAYVDDVAGRAGISGVATDPFDWGVPALSFAALSAVRDLTPSRREDTRFTIAYTLTRPVRNHTVRIGGDYRVDRSSSQTDSNARGAFVFTGLYASGGRSTVPRASGLDFADFLLGLPQQASTQYGPGVVDMRGRSMSLFVQDDWRKSGTLTFNVGVRYELLWPFLEGNRHMVNLDTPPDFTAAVPVLSGGTGPFSGPFPDALMKADANNVAPRAGFAWRVKPGLVVRGGYGISFNAGSYAGIARQLVAQPPFAETNTVIGTVDAPLALSDPFAAAAPTDTANNYGVARDYALGLVQTWNADVARDLGQVWNAGAGYTYTRGSSLDIVRAPNRDPDGLRIDGVQPFLWQSSEGASVLHAGTFRLLRRPVRGIGGSLTYTLARARDNASTIGGGQTVVAQDDRNLEAEWGLSSFDRRHQLNASVNVELPFGPNRPWLNGGGFWARVLENWRVSATYAWQSGTPLTPRAVGAAADVARGTNGTLRADYNGQPVQLDDPTIDRFFNVAAFSPPIAGRFGTASRNMIGGPGSRLLNAQLARDVRLHGNRSVGVQVTASNLLNAVNYANVDTNVNSPSFGRVTSVRPMRSVQLNVRVRF